MSVLSPSLGLAVADYDHPWDGRLARVRVLDWCKKKIQATPYQREIDAACARRAFLLSRDGEPEYTREHWDLPYADVIDDQLKIVPRGVKALGSGHGVIAVTKISSSDRELMKKHTCALYDRVRKQHSQMPECPFSPGKARSNKQPVNASIGGLTVEPITITASAEGTLIEVNGQSIFVRHGAAEVLGDVDLSFALTAAIADPARGWDASGAQSRVIAHCEGKEDSCWKRAYLVPGATPSASKFPVYDVVDGELTLIPRALIAAAGRIGQAKGVDTGALKSKICSLYSQVQSKYDDFPDCPLKSDSDSDMEAAAKPDMDEDECEKGDTECEQAAAKKKRAKSSYSYQTAALTAAATDTKQIGKYTVPLYPPAEWFMPQSNQGPIPLTITSDGRVFGHGALWDSCHAGYTDKCVPVPRSYEDYRHFHRGAVATQDNTLMAVGHLTVGAGHADHNLGIKAAAEHYDDATTTVAVVSAHEDRWGIYLAGALVADTNPEKIAMLLRSPLSGDWRRAEGNLELIAMHGVNVPGFGVDRPRQAIAASGALIIENCALCQDDLDSRISLAASILIPQETGE